MSMRSEARRCTDTFKDEYADNVCRVGEVLLSFTSGILTLVTFGTGFWLQAKYRTTEGFAYRNEYHLGLWQNCTIYVTPVCENISLNGPGHFISTRIFMCLALIACLLSWVLSIIGLLHHRYQWLFAATITYTMQAIGLMIGLVSFSPALKQLDDGIAISPGWSYGMGWLSMVLSITCALYFVCVGWYRFKNPTTPILLPFPSESRSYAPLAQFESTETGSDDDYDSD